MTENAPTDKDGIPRAPIVPMDWLPPIPTPMENWSRPQDYSSHQAPPHGTLRGFQMGCTCGMCRAAGKAQNGTEPVIEQTPEPITQVTPQPRRSTEDD